MKPKVYDYVIIGAGVYGLCSALSLSETGAKILILEKYQIGNSHGSSHGTSKITQNIYKNEFYRTLN